MRKDPRARLRSVVMEVSVLRHSCADLFCVILTSNSKIKAGNDQFKDKIRLKSIILKSIID